MEWDDCKKKLETYHQEHVIKAYQRANETVRKKLLEQVASIDFEQLQRLYSLANTTVQMGESTIEPMPHQEAENLPEAVKKQYLTLGEEILQTGKLAVVTMAGGQGTRLGHHGPKGTFDIGLASHRSLFELFADYLKARCEKYHTTIPWYLMTSKENHADTVKFFEEHAFFHYPQEGIRMFFKQGELPMLDENGNVILNEEGLIKEAADGHGGIFEAMFQEGVLEDMKQRGVEWVFIGGVDNPLTPMADPLFLGFAKANHFLAASKTLVKAYPEEKVGVFCKKDGKPCVVEYTEISPEMANLRDEKGELVYGESHVLLNLFHIDALYKIKEVKLPYHCAHKKANWMDEAGNIIVPQEPNAYKFEAFLFDAFSLLPEVGLLRGKREEEFAPVKNATGNDSPETARKLYQAFYGENA